MHYGTKLSYWCKGCAKNPAHSLTTQKVASRSHAGRSTVPLTHMVPPYIIHCFHDHNVCPTVHSPTASRVYIHMLDTHTFLSCQTGKPQWEWDSRLYLSASQVCMCIHYMDCCQCVPTPTHLTMIWDHNRIHLHTPKYCMIFSPTYVMLNLLLAL